MHKVAILTDSTAYLPAGLMEDYPIFSVPLSVIWDADTFEDGITISPFEFYERLKTARQMPTTSQPSVGQMKQTMDALLDQEYNILGIFVSAQLSGTLQSATQAQALLPAGSAVKLLDSQSTTLAMGFQVLAAARAADQGAGLDDCLAAAEEARAHSGVYFMVDTLEFLHRGGRIGGAQRFLGTALKMKPILYMHNGRIESKEQVRTKSRALDRLVEIVAENSAGGQDLRLAAIHANAPEDANYVLQAAIERMHPLETITAELSPVIGAHVGPGTVALAYVTAG